MIRSLLIAVGLLVAWSAYVTSYPAPRYVIVPGQSDANRLAIDRYRHGTKPVAVIVGSSLSARLGPGSLPQCVVNLGLGGDSALSGLQIVEQKAAKPRVLLIETNLLHRPAGTIAETESWLHARLPALWVENTPLNRLMTLAAGKRQGPPVTVAPTQAVLAGPLEIQRGLYENRLPAPALAAELAGVATIVSRLQRAGVRVILFEMPVNPAIEASPLSLQLREAVRLALPGLPLLSARELAAGQQFTTMDGVHLATAEAAIVARRITSLLPACAAIPAHS